MKFFKYIARGLSFFLTSLNLVLGLVVGSVFGSLCGLFIMLNVGDDGQFSDHWQWWVGPGAILGAIAGIKMWPFMLAFFFGAAADAGDMDTDFNFSGSDGSESGTNGPEHKPNARKGGAW